MQFLSNFCSGALFNFMKSESRDKDVSDINEMVERDFKFYILDSSEEYISGMPKVVER